MMTTLNEAMRNGPVVLDGGLGTHLEARGNSVASALWSARLLLENPDEVRAAHRDFFEAGAMVATTCSYQVTYDGFARLSKGEVDELLRRSARLARLAREDAGLDEGEAWVLASVGPYGAGPGRGTEYDGDYGLSVRELRAWHRPRIEVLAEAGADALLFETIPSLDEVTAICEELDGTGIAALVSVTVQEGALRSGDSLSAVAAACRLDEVVALGVNCSSIPDVDAALAVLASESDKPLLAYPNSGEVWDHESRTWSGDALAVDWYAEEWARRGVALVGGCCRVTVDDIARIRRRVSPSG